MKAAFPLAVAALVLACGVILVMTLDSDPSPEHGRAGPAHRESSDENPAGKGQPPPALPAAGPGRMQPPGKVVVEDKACIRGRVLGPGGKAVAGAHIIQFFLRMDTGIKQDPLADTDEKGDFRVELIPRPFLGNNRSWLFAWKEGYAPGRSKSFEVVAGRTVEDITIRLSRGGGVEGRVVRSDGIPLPRVHVDMRGSDPVMGFLSFRTRTDEKGRYRIQDIPSGAYRICTRCGNLQEVRDGVGVVAGESTRGVDFIMKTGRIISGVVTGNERKPLKGARIRAMETGGRHQAVAQTDETGAFRLINLKDSLYTLAISLAGYETSTIPRIVSGAPSVEVTLTRIHPLAGRVFMPDGATPCAEFGVQTLYERSGDWFHGTRKQFKTSKGEFSFPSTLFLDKGPFKVRACTRDGLVATSSPVHLQTGARPTLIRLVLTKGASVSGLVQEETGSPIPEAEIQIRPEGGHWQRTARCDAQGRFQILSLPPGPYIVAGTHPDWVGAFEKVALGKGIDQRVMLVLSAGGGTLHLTVLGRDGLPVPDAEVSVSCQVLTPVADFKKYRKRFEEQKKSRPDLVWETYRRGLTRTDRNGCLDRGFLPPAPHRVRVMARGFQPASRVVMVPPKGGVAVQIVLEKESPDRGRWHGRRWERKTKDD